MVNRKNHNKKTNPTKKAGGPFLAAAVFCESILEDKDRVISVIRVIDGCQVFITPNAPPEVPSKAVPVQVSQNVLVSFRSGDAPGKHLLKLVLEQPDGKRSDIAEQEIELSPEPHGGSNIKIAATMLVYSSGVFWIDVNLDNKRFTRMPLRVSIQRLPMPEASSMKLTEVK